MDTYCHDKITESDLCNQKYSIDVLEKYFHSLNTKVVLKTQDLTALFCVKYILDTSIDYRTKDHSMCYTKNIILRYQKHISEEEFDTAYSYYLEKSAKIKPEL
jgi:hypothetical protein